ncbi:MAG: exosortase/archaeosortase family protein [Candidatus Rokuibacteriota bacterium]
MSRTSANLNLNLDSANSSWPKNGIAAAILAAILVTLYWPILTGLVIQWWSDANYSHGFLVPLFSGFLVWRERARLAGVVPRGNLSGLAVLIGGVGILILGSIGAENFLMRASLIIVISGLVLFHLGARSFRILFFPLAFLFFMVPLPGVVFYAVTFPLQRLAAEHAAWILDLLGVPVLLDGNVIHLSHITLGVTEACSGIRSLIALLAGAVAWAYFMLPLGVISTAFVLSAIPITIFANAARVVATGLIGQWFGVEYASGFFHEFAGLAVYTFALASLAGVYTLARPLVAPTAAPPV